MGKRKPREKDPLEAEVPESLEGFLPCTSRVFSEAQKKNLPPEIGDLLRASGLNAHGEIALGFFPGAFLDPALGVYVPDLSWGEGATISVGFLDSLGDFPDHVEHYTRIWSEAANVKFRFMSNPAQADVRITFRNTGSFHSLLGKETLGVADKSQPTMSLGFQRDETRQEEIRRLVLHEFGHALGLMHEHQNPIGGIKWNWPVAISYYRRLIRFPPGTPAQEVDRLIAQQLASVPTSSKYKASQFDKDSVMLYQIPPELVVSGTPGSAGEFMQNNTTLSRGDRSVIAEIYGPTGTGGPATEAVRLAIDGIMRTDSISQDGEVDRYVFTVKTRGVYVISTTGDALVHVTLADANFKPIPGDNGADSISPRYGVTMQRLLDPGDYSLLVNASVFSPASRGEYTIRIESD